MTPDSESMPRETQHSSRPVRATLPEFESPPLFETVFGVRFPRLQGWDLRHFGLFWERVRKDYPHFETKQPLPPPAPARGLVSDGFAIQLSMEPEVRCWYLVPGGTRLLQIQHDGFFHNWRKVTLEEKYPRYDDTIRPAFEGAWQRFLSYLEEQHIRHPEVVECEATYVNHFEGGQAEDQCELLRWLSDATPRPTRLTLNASVPMGDHALDVVFTPAVRRHDSKEIIQMNLTTKGRPASSETADVMRWMDGAREAIVRGFVELTTDKMHKLWKRTR